MFVVDSTRGSRATATTTSSVQRLIPLFSFLHDIFTPSPGSAISYPPLFDPSLRPYHYQLKLSVVTLDLMTGFKEAVSPRPNATLLSFSKTVLLFHYGTPSYDLAHPLVFPLAQEGNTVSVIGTYTRLIITNCTSTKTINITYRLNGHCSLQWRRVSFMGSSLRTRGR